MKLSHVDGSRWLPYDGKNTMEVNGYHLFGYQPSILQNIFFCAQQKKEILIWNNMERQVNNLLLTA